MKNKIIINVPHSSTKLTKEFKKQKKFLTMQEINSFNLQMTDLFTKQLFSASKFNHVCAKYSRICCDVEKFADDEIEIMAKYGLGVIYKNNIDGKKLLDDDENYRQKILKKYYCPYHKKLDRISTKLLKNNKVIFVDCHSFSKDIIKTELTKPLPDICIGVEQNLYSNKKLEDFLVNYFQSLGLKVEINYPYQGTMIPNILFKNNNKNFLSFMIEVNRELYLTNNKKSSNFKNLQKQILGLLTKLKTLNLFD